MEYFAENKDKLVLVALPATGIVLLLSIIYTFRNILKLWNAGNPRTLVDSSVTKRDSDASAGEESEEENEEERNGKSVEENLIDPLQYCEHIQSEVKKARHRVATKEIRRNLTAEEMENEREIQRKQIEDIFKLMEQHSDKFGVASEDDVRQQMKLYV